MLVPFGGHFRVLGGLLGCSGCSGRGAFGRRTLDGPLAGSLAARRIAGFLGVPDEGADHHSIGWVGGPGTCARGNLWKHLTAPACLLFHTPCVPSEEGVRRVE
jgi:hypothetical protein